MKPSLPHPPSAPPAEPERTYLLVSTSRPLAAAAALRGADGPPDLCVTSPSAAARETAAFAAGGRYVRTIDEPLLARRADGESLDDLAARYAEALRVLHALTSRRTLVVVDELPPRYDGVLALDDAELLRCADRVEQDVTPR